jgi:hypothetical protein
MGKPPSISSAFDGPELHLYRHISVADFDPRQWRNDATGRLIIHRDGCPGLSGRGTCRCHQHGRGVDILWLVPQRESPPTTPKRHLSERLAKEQHWRYG